MAQMATTGPSCAKTRQCPLTVELSPNDPAAAADNRETEKSTAGAEEMNWRLDKGFGGFN
jgi:hypothetical protein